MTTKTPKKRKLHSCPNDIIMRFQPGENLPTDGCVLPMIASLSQRPIKVHVSRVMGQQAHEDGQVDLIIHGWKEYTD